MDSHCVENKADYVTALTIDSQPELQHFYSEDGVFDHVLLQKTQLMPSNILELRDIVEDVSIPFYPVVFCLLPGMRGCVYLEGEIEWPIVFIDITKMDSAASLIETYIHEAAHLASDGQDHDFRFSVALNSFRLAAGLPPSDSDYDYRAVVDDGMALEDSKLLSVEYSKVIVDLKIPTVVAFSCAKGYFNEWVDYVHGLHAFESYLKGTISTL